MIRAAVFAISMQLVALQASENPLLEELSARPQATAADVYKLLHQSVFGPGHIISSRDSARDYLQKEMAGLGPARTGEKMLDNIGEGMTRVNLRPFRDSGGSVESLLDAMIETANSNVGRPMTMAAKVAAAVELLKNKGKEGLANDLAELGEKYATKGWPALRHSEDYRKAYTPSYRVVEESKFFAGAK
jgi:hypothetical protein